jgi:hypothetical protein
MFHNVINSEIFLANPVPFRPTSLCQQEFNVSFDNGELRDQWLRLI